MQLSNAIRKFHWTITKDQHSSNHYAETLNKPVFSIDFVNYTKNVVLILEDDMPVGFRVNMERRSMQSLQK